jgi:hypothetical protein
MCFDEIAWIIEQTLHSPRFAAIHLRNLTQHFPDSPNRPHFPSTKPVVGQVFRSTTVMRFLA